MKNADKSAYPFVHDENLEWDKGLTKRERFAMAAMQGLIASGMTYNGETTNRNLLAKDAVEHADALLKELE